MGRFSDAVGLGRPAAQPAVYNRSEQRRNLRPCPQLVVPQRL